MAGQIKTFPKSGHIFIPVPCAVTLGQTVIVPPSYTINGNAQEIEILANDPLNPNLNYSPVMAVQIAPAAMLGVEVAAATSARSHSWWLLEVRSMDGVSVPPPIDWQIRTCFGNSPEVVASGSLNLSTFNDSGKIVEVSGYSFNQVEFWARSTGTARAKLVLGLTIDRSGGATPSIVKGSVAK